MIEFRPYAPPSFWTTQGAWAKQRQLEKRGFPSDLRNWRFVTLTMDPKQYPEPVFAWMLGKRHLRQFVYLLKKKYGIRRWCWKLEFHEPDEETGKTYPHWHLLFDYKARIDKDELAALWGKGRTQIKCVDNEKFDYLFKYAVKAIDHIPEWILNRTNVRLFQTSKGFFPTDSAVLKKDAKPSPRQPDDDQVRDTQNYSPKTETIGERLQRWSRYVVSRSISETGSVSHRTYEMICDSWGQLLVRLGRVKIRNSVSCCDLNIKENVIEISCLSLISNYLPAST